jgi:hypothetical protein
MEKKNLMSNKEYAKIVLADVIKRLTEEKGIIGLDRLQTTRQASKFRRGMGTLYNLAKGKGR